MPRKPAATWDDIPDEEQMSDEERPFEAEELPPVIPAVAPPETAEDDLQRYERRLDPGVQVIDKASYSSLLGFVTDRPDREKWKLAIFRCADIGVRDRSRFAYVTRIPIPQGILDEYVKENFGGGAYRWQLCLTNRFAGRADLPQSMQDIPMEGYLDIDAPVKGSDSDAVANHAASVTEINSANDRILQLTMDTMKEQMEKVRGDSKANTDALVQMSNVMLGGMQSQMTLMQTVAGQQNTFLMGLLDRQRDEVKGRMDEKSGMYDKMLELVMKFSGKGDEGAAGAESTLQTVVKSFPAVIEMLGKNPMFSAPPSGSPVAQTPALPTPVAAQPVQPSAPAAPAEKGLDEMWAIYLTKIVTQCYSLFQSSVPPHAAASVVASLGSDADYERFYAMSEAEVLKLVDDAYRQYVKPEGMPAELTAWVKSLHAVLHEDEDEEGTENEKSTQEPPTIEAAVQSPVGDSPVVEVDAQVVEREPTGEAGAPGARREVQGAVIDGREATTQQQ